MGKLLDRLQKQLETEYKQDAEDCLKIYNELSKQGDGHIWSSIWNPLVSTIFKDFPSNERRFKPTSVGYTFIEGIKNLEKLQTKDNTTYIFLRFDIQDGERTHQHKVLFQTRATNIKFAIHKYLSQYWGESDYDRKDKVWWFFNEITLKLVKYEVLTKEKYDFLTKYLNT